MKNSPGLEPAPAPESWSVTFCGKSHAMGAMHGLDEKQARRIYRRYVAALGNVVGAWVRLKCDNVTVSQFTGSTAEEVMDALIQFAEDPEEVASMSHEECRAYLKAEGVDLDAEFLALQQRLGRTPEVSPCS